MINMMCVLNCNGVILQEPKRAYNKANQEISQFYLYVRRSDRSGKHDVLPFRAFKELANYINNEVHKGDMVALRARPVADKWIDRDGKKKNRIVFNAASIDIICHRERLLIDKFGGSLVPEINEWDFQFWG